MLRSPSIQRVEMSNLNAALNAAATENIKLSHDSPVVGKTLGELDLRNATGATLIAVVRGDDTKIGPGANYKLQENDVLILFGKPENIERAIKLLQPDELTGGFNP
jgi:TrkA domain protein